MNRLVKAPNRAGPVRAARVRCGRVLIGVFLVLLGGCEGSAPDAASGSRAGDPGAGEGAAIQLLDDAGRRWTLSAPPTRIVSLVPAATDVLLALGAGDLLVGRTDYDTDPALAPLPSVGGGLGPSLEVLVTLRPDVVIRFEGPTDRETPSRLDALGIPHLGVRPDRVEDVTRIIALLGALLGRDSEARTLVEEMRLELEAVREAVAGAPRPRVGILLGGDPPWMAGGRTFLHEIVEAAGGDNVFGEEGPLYAPISVEQILLRSPDLLILSETARVPEGLRGIPVIRGPSALQTPGPDLGRTARAVARLLHPDRVP